MMNRNHYAVLLAGGAGSRLSPFSTPEFPKQFFRLPGKSRSLFQQTAWDAVAVFGAEKVFTVARSQYLPRIRSELGALSPALVDNIIEEADPKGTATAAMLAAQRAGVGAVLWLLPCDHVRSKALSESFTYAAAKAADKEKIVIFGFTPQSADTRFGYLLTREDGSVRQFVEKPPLPMAEAFLAEKGTYWNSGITAIKTNVLVQTLKQYAPEVLTGKLSAPLSLDHAVLERSHSLIAFPFNDPAWMDLGTQEALYSWWRDNAPQISEWDFGSGKRVELDALL